MKKLILCLAVATAGLAFGETTVQVPGVSIQTNDAKPQMVAQGTLPAGSTGATVELPAPASSIKITTNGNCPSIATVKIDGKTLVVKGNGSLPLTDNVKNIEVSLSQEANQSCQVQVVGTPADDYENYDGGQGVNINIGGNNYGNITVGQGQQATNSYPTYQVPTYTYQVPTYTYQVPTYTYQVPVTLTPVYTVPTYGYTYGYIY